MTKTLKLYKEGSTWYFDDKEKGIEKEPFVQGSSEIISSTVGRDVKKLQLTFSDSEQFPNYLYKLEEQGDWTHYYSEKLKMYGWLCPVLYKYFDSPPKTIFYTIH